MTDSELGWFPLKMLMVSKLLNTSTMLLKSYKQRLLSYDWWFVKDHLCMKADTGIAVEGATCRQIRFRYCFLAPVVCYYWCFKDPTECTLTLFTESLSSFRNLLRFMDCHSQILGYWFAVSCYLRRCYFGWMLHLPSLLWNLPIYVVCPFRYYFLAIAWISLTPCSTKRWCYPNFGSIDGVLFLEISLTENWLIFVTRAKLVHSGPLYLY